jgi:uncharacterized protein YjbI with pentapeptide repeats
MAETNQVIVVQDSSSDSEQRLCHYNAAARGSSTDAKCIFDVDPERLTRIEGVWFCPYHLPWSPWDLEYRFGIEISENDPTRSNLKDHWDEGRRDLFHKTLVRRISDAEGNIDLAGVVTAGDFSLKEIVCKSYLNMADAYFSGQVHFDSVCFALGTSFKSAVFDQGCSFRCSFEFDADFSKALFRQSSSFGACRFRGRTRFDRCVFDGPVHFTGSTFEESITFDRALFCSNSMFNDVTFKWLLVCTNVEFRGEADFACTGSHTPEIGWANFSGCLFSGEAYFDRRQFTSQLDFKDATFETVPRFNGAAIPFSVTFPPINHFLDWQRRPRRRGFFLFTTPGNYSHFEEMSNRYRTLRHLMKQQDAYQEEAMFWELEMRAKERSLPLHRPGNWLPLLVAKLYRISSRYGNSITRPIVFWLLVTVFFAIVVGSVSGHKPRHWDTIRLERSIEFSLQQTVRPLSVWSKEGEEMIRRSIFDLSDGNSNPTGRSLLLVKMVATLETTICLTLIALFGFAIRRRFRMV